MMKRKKREKIARQMAAQAATNGASPSTPQKTRAAVVRVPSSARDPLLGVPLVTNTLRLPVRDWDASRPKGSRVPIPTTLHMRRPTPGHGIDRMGSPSWSVPFRKYISPVVMKGSPKASELAHTQWWTHPQVEQELYLTYPTQAVDAVLGVYRDGECWESAAARVHRPISYLARYERAMRHHMQTLIKAELRAAS